MRRRRHPQDHRRRARGRWCVSRPPALAQEGRAEEGRRAGRGTRHRSGGREIGARQEAGRRRGVERGRESRRAERQGGGPQQVQSQRAERRTLCVGSAAGYEVHCRLQNARALTAQSRNRLFFAGFDRRAASSSPAAVAALGATLRSSAAAFEWQHRRCSAFLNKPTSQPTQPLKMRCGLGLSGRSSRRSGCGAQTCCRCASPRASVGWPSCAAPHSCDRSRFSSQLQ